MGVAFSTMGNACKTMTQEDKVKTKRSREVDTLLKNFNTELQEEVKLLLLGPGESGKSTIFKQMKILQLGGGFTEQELKAYRYIVFGNCITQMKVIVAAAEKLGIEYASPENKVRAERVAQVPAGGDAWSAQVAEDIKALWADSGIRETYDQRDKSYQLNDSAAYFFDEIDRFAVENYTPTENDVLRARVRSTGIDEADFEFENLNFRMLDVGGQRSERRKWIHCFDCVTAVIFCASLSEYDQTLREDDSQNRMKESLLLFDEICNSPWFRDTAFVLFLNKTDLFKVKVKTVPLTDCFPDYSGGMEYEPAAAFIEKKFIATNTSNTHKIYPHRTCAIDKENIRLVFNVVQTTLLEAVLANTVM